MLSVCSFNGVKIGWWHHAILALNFSQKKPFVVIYFVFLNSELWEKWKDEHLALEFGLDSSDFPRWLKYWTDCVTGVDGNWFAASSSRTKEIVDGQAILFFFNELFSKCFFFFFLSSLWLSLSEAAAGGNREKPWQWFLINLDRVRRHNGIQSSHCVSTPSKQQSPDSYSSSSFFLFLVA